MNWKNGRPKGTVKAVWQKTGMAIKKKKKRRRDRSTTRGTGMPMKKWKDREQNEDG
jgi:hypothetical protein